MSTESSSPQRSIVGGVDGAPPSVDALQGAVRIAEPVGTQIDAATSWEYPTSFGWADVTQLDGDPAADAPDGRNSARRNEDCGGNRR